MNHDYNIKLTSLYAQTLFRFLKKIVRNFISDSSKKELTNEESLLLIIEHTVARIFDPTLIEITRKQSPVEFYTIELSSTTNELRYYG